MFDTILGFVTNNLLFTAPIGGAIIAVILRQIDNDAIQSAVQWPFNKIAYALGGLSEGAGIFLTTLFGGKFRYTKPFWNKLIEPYLIDAINNIVVTVIERTTNIINTIAQRFIKGLRSDN